MAGEKHKNKTTWGKGKSGNPGGRSPRLGPNGESLTELCRAITVEAVDTLKLLMLDKAGDPKDRITAAIALLDRGWGKPTEKVDMEARVEQLGVPVIQFLCYDDERPADSTH